jgi:hypothetical protein
MGTMAAMGSNENESALGKIGQEMGKQMGKMASDGDKFQ